MNKHYQKLLHFGLLLLFAGVAVKASIPLTKAHHGVGSAYSQQEETERSQVASMDVQWIDGAPDCETNNEPAIQVHTFNATTYVLRQNPCLTFEAPFMYLLIGQSRALLVDSGAIADETVAPLAATVRALLADQGQSDMPLIVSHSHSHHDHRAGDDQFINLPNVEIVGPELTDVQQFFGLADWPQDVASFDLGQRVLEIVPVPGHHPTSIAIFDTSTGLLFSGDFLLPGRLYINDVEAFRASSRRLATFVQNRPVSHVLGGHLEMDAAGDLYSPQATHHPNERPLQLTANDVLVLENALTAFGRFTPFKQTETFILVNYQFLLPAAGVLLLATLVGLAWMAIYLFKRIRRRPVRTRVSDTAISSQRQPAS